ncbi:hypothetical protein ABIA24_006737 [Sinorhizobium fredii]
MPRAIGRLLLAAKKGNGLVYVGGCGTGWSNEESVQLRELLDAIPVARPPVTLKRKSAVFSEPLLVAEHPSFKGVKKRGAQGEGVFSGQVDDAPAASDGAANRSRRDRSLRCHGLLPHWSLTFNVLLIVPQCLFIRWVNVDRRSAATRAVPKVLGDLRPGKYLIAMKAEPPIGKGAE